jgi:hypothetical protein
LIIVRLRYGVLVNYNPKGVPKSLSTSRALLLLLCGEEFEGALYLEIDVL